MLLKLIVPHRFSSPQKNWKWRKRNHKKLTLKNECGEIPFETIYEVNLWLTTINEHVYKSSEKQFRSELECSKRHNEFCIGKNVHEEKPLHFPFDSFCVWNNLRSRRFNLTAAFGFLLGYNPFHFKHSKCQRIKFACGKTWSKIGLRVHWLSN